MLTIDRYVRAQSLDEAYELCQKRNNVVLGGMLWLKMQRRRVAAAIDLCNLGLDYVKETEEAFEIGAMTSLRTLEQHEGLDQLTQGALARSVEHIVGVQFRNCATVGGSVFGRFGFSDVLTVLLALDAEVELYKGGVMPLEQFCRMGVVRDILTRVIVPKGDVRASYLSQRNTETDFPVLTCAVVRRAGEYRVAVGARPRMAEVFADEKGLLAGGVAPDGARALAEDIAGRAVFDSNLRGSAEYRRQICKVLVRRALMALEGEC